MGAAATLLYGPRVALDAAAWVRQVRDATGLSQERFAEHVDASRSAVARWEAGENEPEFRNVQAIITAFPESAAMLAGATDKRPTEPLLKNMETREIAQIVDRLPVIKRIYVRDMVYRILGRTRPTADPA
jgi:predicted transcriptional regulator